MVTRIVRVIRLDRSVYDEVGHDTHIGFMTSVVSS